MRLSWEEYALRIAEVASLRSEDPFMKVGACALNHSNRVIGVSYNGLATGVNVYVPSALTTTVPTFGIVAVVPAA